MDIPENDPGATVEAAAVDPGYALAERVRGASFKVTRRGYDRGEVDRFLAWLADELRGAELAPVGPSDDPDAMRRELERVGESTAEILRAAEQTARELRGGAKRDADNLVASARADADRLRDESSEFATQTKSSIEEEMRAQQLEAGQRADELVREAESRAESIVEDALQRRRLLAARVEQLAERRGAILAELGRLSDELTAVRESAAASEAAMPDLGDDLAEDEEGAEAADFDDDEAYDEPPGEVIDDLDDLDEQDELDALDEEPLPGDATEVIDPFEQPPEGEADADGEPEWPK
jgi:DivIVA domain-containing protein